MRSNQEKDIFLPVFFTAMIILVSMLLAVSKITTASDNYVKPLNKSQQQAIVSQVGIDGYKNLIKNKCYQSLVIRIQTDRWNDQYCAKSYRHLNYRKILVGEI